MTKEERKEVLQTLEKPFHGSKKWLAWFIQQLLMTGMAIVALIKQPELGWPLASYMTGIVFMMGVSTMWYLGKQAAADIAVRGFALAEEIPKRLGSPYTTPEAKKEENPT